MDAGQLERLFVDPLVLSKRHLTKADAEAAADDCAEAADCAGAAVE